MTRPPNAGAQLYRTSTTPPFTICLRPHQEIDDKIRMSARYSACWLKMRDGVESRFTEVCFHCDSSTQWSEMH